MRNLDICLDWPFLFSNIGWRLGLQAVTGVIFLTFFLGTFYRSASLYHPQRRAILHLKSQKRKIKSKDKEKNKAQDDRPPYFDFATLKSRTVQILLASIAIASFGLNVPIFFMVSCHTQWHTNNFSSLIFVFSLNRPILKDFQAAQCWSFRPIWASLGSLVVGFLELLSSATPRSVEFPSNISAKRLSCCVVCQCWPLQLLKATMAMCSLCGFMAFSVEATITRLRSTFMKKFGRETLLGHGDLLNSQCQFQTSLARQLQVTFIIRN